MNIQYLRFSIMAFLSSMRKHWPILLFSLLSAAGVIYAFLGTFSNALVWDDLAYITEYAHSGLPIFSRLPELFSVREFFLGNYHPLTIFSYRIDHALATDAFWAHRFTNIILHLCNTGLVFILIARLLRQSGYQQPVYTAAGLSALLFAVHPLHVESVAWLAGRKDLLYSFFYLTAAYAYISYLRSYRYRYYATALLCFLLALGSKAMAAALPLTLILIDYISWRPLLKRRVILEKIPFFILALYFGLVAIGAQATAHAISDKSAYQLWERALIILYSPGHYTLKTFLPFSLSVFYPYPFAPGATPSALTWLGAGITVLLLATAFYFRKSHRIITFSILFFFANILMVLQFIPVGNAPVADRYHYMAGIGLLIPVAYLIIKSSHKETIRNTLIIIIMIASAAMIWQTRERVSIWKDHISLWSDVIEKHPGVSSAWLSRGSEYYNRGQFLKAQSDLNQALKINPRYVLAYNNRGLTFNARGEYLRAIQDYSAALRIKASPQVYYNRAVTYTNAGQKERAIADLDSCLRLSPGMPNAIQRRGLLLYELGRYEKALADYNYLVYNRPDYQNLSQRAAIHSRLGNHPQAIADMARAIETNPGSPALWYNQGNILSKAGKSSQAIESYSRAIALDPGLDQAWINRANEMNKSGQYQDVITDMDALIAAGRGASFAYLHKGLALAETGRREEACKYFQTALDMGNPAASDKMETWCK